MLPTGSISGVVFVDANNDGVREAGEAALNAASLYLDLNNNGSPDPGEPSATTNSIGEYLFFSIRTGNYTVREIVPSGYRVTAPLGYSGVVTVLNAVTAPGPTFGDVRASTVTMSFNYLLTLAQHYSQPGTFASGDVNGDGTVNFADLLLVAQNYGHPLSASAVAAQTSLPDPLTHLRREFFRERS